MKPNTALAMYAALLPLAAAAAAPRIVAPRRGSEVPLLSEAKRSFLAMDETAARAAFADESFRAALAADGCWPESVSLAWSPAPEWEGLHPLYAVTLRRLPDGLPVYFAETTDTQVSVDNLEIAREYEWTVRATVMGEPAAPATATFRTECAAPRLMRMPGVPNVRDFGGRVGIGGRRVRQGLVYRSAGLNENAAEGRFAREEVLAAAHDSDSLLAREKDLLAQSSQFAAFSREPGSAGDFLEVPQMRQWTVFRPSEDSFAAGGDATLSAMRRIPESFCGAPAESVEADLDGRVEFAGFSRDNAGGPAVFVKELVFPQDGWIALGCGADWFWDLRVDGEIQVDHSDPDGNHRYPPAASNRVFAVRVHAGTNLLSAVVRAGGSGWVWCCAAMPAASAADAFSRRAENAGRRARYLFYLPGEIAPGPSRVSDSIRPVWLGELGVRTDLDLRSEGECRGMEGSPLGPGVDWVRISSAAYGAMQEPWGREAFARAFRLFLDRSSYPIDFHCIAGADRTGSLAFILGALLGVEEPDLRRDWEATAFWNADRDFVHSARYDKLLSGFDAWPGQTLRERVEAYVLAAGFTSADIETFRSTMLEPSTTDTKEQP